MKRACGLVFLVATVSCGGGSSPSTPTPTPTPTPAPAPAPIASANLQWVPSQGVYSCFTGQCTSLTVPIINVGPGCATNVQVTVRAFGSDGDGAQLGVDIPMGLPGGALTNVYFGVGTTVTIQNLGPFNDVRSAHTVFKAFASATNVVCR
jgi:hypothetical protein